MTPEEIKQKKHDGPTWDAVQASWLKEIAYQLALLNEKADRAYKEQQ